MTGIPMILSSVWCVQHGNTYVMYSLVLLMMCRVRGLMPVGSFSSAWIRGISSPVSRFFIITLARISWHTHTYTHTPCQWPINDKSPASVQNHLWERLWKKVTWRLFVKNEVEGELDDRRQQWRPEWLKPGFTGIMLLECIAISRKGNGKKQPSWWPWPWPCTHTHTHTHAHTPHQWALGPSRSAASVVLESHYRLDLTPARHFPGNTHKQTHTRWLI